MKELTVMQAAYCAGRVSSLPLCGVASHLYKEFDGVGLDVELLEKSVQLLYRKHPMLRLSITDDGLQKIRSISAQHKLNIDDMRTFSEEQINVALNMKREKKTSQQLSIKQGVVIDFSVSLLPKKQFRFHIDIDMVAIDAQSLRIIMEELVHFYKFPHSTRVKTPSYFEYLEHKKNNAELMLLQTRDKQWWQYKINNLPPAPDLPYVYDKKWPKNECPTQRYGILVTKEKRIYLEKIAKQYHITMTTLLLTLFVVTIRFWCSANQFRINVPLFHREKIMPDVESIVGEFSNLLIMGVVFIADEKLEDFAQRIALSLAELITHRHYSGVNVMRDLSRIHGSLQSSPIVFTSGFGVNGDLFSQEVTDTLGKMTWTISQGAHVALDAQVVPAYEGILINWDVRVDVFPDNLIKTMFDKYISFINDLIQDPQLFNEPVKNILIIRKSNRTDNHAKSLLMHSQHDEFQHSDIKKNTVMSQVETLLWVLLSRALNKSAQELSYITAITPQINNEVKAQLSYFINKYINGVTLSLEHFNQYPTFTELAQMIISQSPQHAEKMAETILKVLKR